MSDIDFTANASDGHGSDWPIRYRDLAPWYDHVEQFAGISGSVENLAQLPDGQFLPAMALTDPELDFKRRLEKAFPGRHLIPGRCAHLTKARPHHEEQGRASCQYRSVCDRGCSYGAYFSSLSSTLPAARKTGNVTIVTDAVVHSLIHDDATGRVTGVRVIDAKTKEGRTYEARVIFLCASAIASAQILLNSRSDSKPTGLANSSGAVGRYLMDHLWGMSSAAVYPGYEDIYHRGRRPSGFYIPRYQNLPGDAPSKFLRGFGFQGGIMRAGWKQKAQSVGGIGKDLKDQLRTPGPWTVFMAGFGEMLPNPENRVTLHASAVDKWGIPIVHIDCALGENEHKIVEQSYVDAREMFGAAGAEFKMQIPFYGGAGLGIHEMGTAHMGKDPKTSVLNGFNQAHDIPNLFITDGSAMASGGCQNPSLTYMALSARGAHHAVQFLKEGII